MLQIPRRITLLAALLVACAPETETPSTPSAPEEKSSNGDPSSTPSATSDSTSAPKAATFRNLELEWKVQKPDGSPDQCPAAYSKLKVNAGNTSGSASRNGDSFVQVFDCAAGKGSIRLQTSGDEDLKPNADGSYPHSAARDMTGKYNVTMVITEPSGETDYQAFPSQSIDLTNGDGKLSFVITPSATNRLTIWGFRAKSTGDNISCAAAGVDHVRVKSKRVMLPDDSPDPSPKESVEEFPCANELERVDCFGCSGGGTSKPLEFGRYATSIEALANGQVVGTLPYSEDGLVILDRNGVRVIGGGGADWASVYMGSSFFFDITTR